MQCYLRVKISDLNDCASKSVHEFSEGLVVCLSQTGQNSQGYAVRPVGVILHIESFDEGVKALYGPRWESTIPIQCRLLEGCWKDMTYNRIIISVEVRLSLEGI